MKYVLLRKLQVESTILCNLRIFDKQSQWTSDQNGSGNFFIWYIFKIIKSSSNNFEKRILKKYCFVDIWDKIKDPLKKWRKNKTCKICSSRKVTLSDIFTSYLLLRKSWTKLFLLCWCYCMNHLSTKNNLAKFQRVKISKSTVFNLLNSYGKRGTSPLTELCLFYKVSSFKTLWNSFLYWVKFHKFKMIFLMPFW